MKKKEKELLHCIGQMPQELIEKTLPASGAQADDAADMPQITVTEQPAPKTRISWLRGGIAAAVAVALIAGNAMLISGLVKLRRGGAQTIPVASVGAEKSPSETETTEKKETIGTETTPAGESTDIKQQPMPEFVGKTLQEAAQEYIEYSQMWSVVCKYVKSDQPADTILAAERSYRTYPTEQGVSWDVGAFEYFLTVSGGQNCSTLTLNIPTGDLAPVDTVLTVCDPNGNILTATKINPAENETPGNETPGTVSMQIPGWGQKALTVCAGEVRLGTWQCDFDANTAVRESEAELFAKRFVAEYCRLAPNVGAVVPSDYTDSADMQAFLSDTVNLYSRIGNGAGEDAHPGQIDLTVTETVQRGELQLMKIGITTTFFSEADHSQVQIVTEEHWVAVKEANGKCELTDWYVPEDAYHAAVRGTVSFEDFGQMFKDRTPAEIKAAQQAYLETLTQP